jgi:hypothetical protein
MTPAKKILWAAASLAPFDGLNGTVPSGGRYPGIRMCIEEWVLADRG